MFKEILKRIGIGILGVLIIIWAWVLYFGSAYFFPYPPG